MASTTSRGTCEPPGPSRNDTARSSAGKRSRTASTSSASRTAAIGISLPERARFHRRAQPRRGVEPERLDQPVADRAQGVLVGDLAGDPAPAADVRRDAAPRHRQRDLPLVARQLDRSPYGPVAVGAEYAEQLAGVTLRQLEHRVTPAL